jgi:hypothetical protein
MVDSNSRELNHQLDCCLFTASLCVFDKGRLKDRTKTLTQINAGKALWGSVAVPAAVPLSQAG